MIAVKRLFAAAIATLIGGAAIANHAQAYEVYKDPTGAVYISGLRSKELVEIAYSLIPNRINVRPSGSCNVIKIPYISKNRGFYPWYSVKVYKDTQQVVSLNGNALNRVDSNAKLCSGTERNTGLNWTSLGSGIYGVSIISQALYLVGLPYAQYAAEDEMPKVRLKAADTCGIVKLSDTPAYPLSKLGNFYFYASTSTGGYPTDDFNVSSLSVKSPHLCSKGVLYNPVP